MPLGLRLVLLRTGSSKFYTAVCFHVVVDKVTNKLIFALFALRNSLLYASGISTTISKELHKPVVELLVKDFLSTSFPFNAFHSFDSASTFVREALKENSSRRLKLLDSNWRCDTDKVYWSPKSLEIKNDEKTSLCLGTMDELPLLIEWTKGFLDHFSMGDGIDVEEMCRQEILKEHTYILYQDDIPVSMAWKRRPLRNSCAVAYVFTPSEHRHKGLGRVCVALLTEVILEDYKYATLFVHGTQDPHSNLYSAIGYRHLGKADRYAIEEE
ncbi:unnamed protein product [Mucor hiemalis]